MEDKIFNTLTTVLSEPEPERQLIVPYSTKANAFCELGRKKIGKNEPCSPQKAFAFVEYGTRSCLSGSDRGVKELEKDDKKSSQTNSSIYLDYQELLDF